MREVLIGLFIFLFVLFNYYATMAPIKPIQVLGCLRIKDSKKHMNDYFKYHFSRGITHFEVFDDSKVPMNIDHPQISYHYVNGKKLSNEQDYIETCFRDAIEGNRFDYVMNLDDDEYLFSNHIFKETDSRCTYLPILYFGSIRTYDTGITPIDFVHRDKTVALDNKYYLQNGAFGVSNNFYYHPKSYSRKVKKRITKAFYKIPDTDIGKFNLLRDLSYNKLSGSYIHGNGMACDFQEFMWIGHYTRSNEELKSRMNDFWKSIQGLKSRFSNTEKVRKYVSQRNRSDEVDMRLHTMSSKVFLKNIQS